jgi:LDH2 family malate/lactate/ureidoglycolate dehydrogenase
MANGIRIAAADLEAFARDILVGAGMPEDRASLVAEVLVGESGAR